MGHCVCPARGSIEWRQKVSESCACVGGFAMQSENLCAIQEKSSVRFSSVLPFRAAGRCCFFAPAEDTLSRAPTLSIAVWEWSFGVLTDELWEQMSDDQSPALVSGFDVSKSPPQLHSGRQL